MGNTQHTTRTTAVAVAFALVILLLLQGLSATGGSPERPETNIGTPHPVTGYAYWPDGSVVDMPIPVTITYVKTGQSAVAFVGNNPVGTYQFDLAVFNVAYNSADIILVNSTYQNMWTHNQTTIGGMAFSMCDLRLEALPFGPALIGAAGGTVSSWDGKLSLEVPAGALSVDTIIYGVTAQDSKPGSFGSITLLPEGTVFGTPATLTWSYEGIDLGIMPPEELAIYTSGGGETVMPTGNLPADAIWEKLPGYVDTVGKNVVAFVSHFSNFSIGGASAFGSQVEMQHAYPGTLNVPILDVTVINSDPVLDDTLDYIEIISNSTDDADIAAVSVWNDLDNDQVAGPGDALIGSMNSASHNFTGLGFGIPANSTLNLLLTADLVGTAVPGNLTDLLIPAGGIGLANGGTLDEAIDPPGHTEVAAELTDPHAVYGYVENVLGAVQYAWVNLTNNRTGVTENLMTDDLGRYEMNLGFMAGGYADSDEIFITANDTLGQTGWNRTWVDAMNFGERCDIYLGVGPIAGNESPSNGSTVFDVLQNITVNITAPMPLNIASIVIEIEGVNYTAPDAALSFAGDTLTFNTSSVGAWTDGQTVNVTLWQANDTAGNALQNAPYTWWFLVSLGVVEDAPDIRVHKAGADINITWAAVTNATSYNIYRSLAVDGTGFNFTTPAATVTELYFIDAGALADGNNYSYIVRGNCAGGEGPKSNIGWKLRKTLVENAATSDINWIALPYNSDLKFAQDLINELGGTANVNYVSRWVAATQSLQNKPPIGGLNWAIVPGEGLLVSMKATLVYTIVGSYNETTMIDITENPATSDINWIALPYHSQLHFAQDLINDLGGTLNVNYVSRWVAATQSLQNKPPVGGLNWAIVPGEGLLVSAKITISNYSLGPVLNP